MLCLLVAPNVEGAPKELKADVKKEEAEELKAKLEAVGGTVTIE